MYDLTTNRSILTCTLEPFENVGDKIIGKNTISFEKDYCLKIRMGESRQLLATMWKRSTHSSTLFNLRLYNSYEDIYDDSLALIEVADGYIGNFCYCNTIAHISQKYSNISGAYICLYSGSK